MHGNALTNSSTIQEVSKQGMVIGMNFNSETITGTAGSETVLDSSGENNHGTNSGATFNESAGFNNGGAFDFDGDNDYINLGDLDDITEGNKSLSVSVWANLNQPSASADGLVCKALSGIRSWCIQRIGTTSLRSRIYFDTGNTEITVTIPETDNKYHHYAFSYNQNNGTHTLYYDGNNVGTDTAPTGLIKNTASSIYVGRSYSGTADYSWNGTMDEVLILNRSLSSNEIKSLYEQRTEVQNSYVSQQDVYVDSDSVDISKDYFVVNGIINATTLNTGQGDNELYDMDQNVLTTSTPTFENITINDKICMDGACSAWLKYNGSCIESSNGGCI